MKLAKIMQAAVPLSALAAAVLAGKLVYSQIDTMPVQLDTMQGDPAVLDGLRLSGLLQQGWQSGGNAFGQWQQEITFSQGAASAQSHFSPQFVQQSYSRLFSDQTVEQLQQQPYLAVNLEGSNWINDWETEEGSLRQRKPEELEIGIGSGNFQDNNLYDTLTQAGLCFTASLPQQQPIFTENDQGCLVEGLRISATSTGPLYSIGDSLYGTISDTCFWSGGWQEEETQITANGSAGSWELEISEPLEYNFTTGLFCFTPQQEGSQLAECLWQLDCTPTGSHLLNLCQAGENRLAVLTVEDGWYQLHSFWPLEGRHTVQELAACTADAIGSAQLEVQGNMLLAKLYKGSLDSTQQAASEYLAVELTEQGGRLVLLAGDETAEKQSSYFRTRGNTWYAEDLLWYNGRIYAITGGDGLCEILALGQEDLYLGYLRGAGMLEGDLEKESTDWSYNYLEWAFQSLSLSVNE